MSRKRLVLVGAVSLALVAVGGMLLLPPPTPVRAYDRIKDGMTLPEVIAIIGMPPGDYDDSGHPRHKRLVRETGISAGCLPDASGSREVYYDGELTVERWLWSEYSILVAFDQNGKAVGIYLLESVGGPRSFLGSVRGWLGI
jgi:hypothetical protein